MSLFLPEITPTTTWHNEGVQTGYISGEGDFTGEAEFEPAQTITSRIFLSEIMVDAAPDARAVVTFGDSITDGAASTPDANHRWPDFLAERLVKAGAKVAVLNEGISGARVLRDRMGDNALARFDRDVLSHAACRHGGADDGDQRHRLAGHDPGAQGRAGARRPRTSSPATSS